MGVTAHRNRTRRCLTTTVILAKARIQCVTFAQRK
jgi:hypothetical protein